MSEKPKEGLNRRDFVIKSVATVCASAVLARGTGPANAQDTAVSSSDAASGASRRTIYTGDVIDGKKVVSALDVNDLEPGQKHLLYFQGVKMPTGQHWYVSVKVARGAKPGKRAVLVSGVHGDEMSSIHTVQTVTAVWTFAGALRHCSWTRWRFRQRRFEPWMGSRQCWSGGLGRRI